MAHVRLKKACSNHTVPQAPKPDFRFLILIRLYHHNLGKHTSLTSESHRFRATAMLSSSGRHPSQCKHAATTVAAASGASAGAASATPQSLGPQYPSPECEQLLPHFSRGGRPARTAAACAPHTASTNASKGDLIGCAPQSLGRCSASADRRTMSREHLPKCAHMASSPPCFREPRTTSSHGSTACALVGFGGGYPSANQVLFGLFLPVHEPHLKDAILSRSQVGSLHTANEHTTPFPAIVHVEGGFVGAGSELSVRGGTCMQSFRACLQD